MQLTKIFALLGLSAFALASPLPADKNLEGAQDSCDRNYYYGDYRNCEAARDQKHRDENRLDRDRNHLGDARDQLNWDRNHGAPYGVIQSDRDRINRDKDRIDRDHYNINGDRARQCANSYPRPNWC